MMTRKNHSTGVRQSINAVLLLAVTFAIVQPASAQSQWTTNGNDISNTNTGNVGIGTTSPQSTLHIASGVSNASRGLTIELNSSDNVASGLWLRKSRGTLAAPQAVVNGDQLAHLGPDAFDGAAYIKAGRIRFITDGPVTTGTVPTAILFETNGLTERMRITSAGNVGVGTTTPLSTLHVASASTDSVRGMILSQHTDDSNSVLFSLLKSRGTSASPTSVLNGDNIGSIFECCHFQCQEGNPDNKLLVL